jgi:hypothetical protein
VIFVLYPIFAAGKGKCGFCLSRKLLVELGIREETVAQGKFPHVKFHLRMAEIEHDSSLRICRSTET